MLSQFLKWWYAQLAALFGMAPGTQSRDHGDFLCLRLEADQLRVGTRLRGRYRPLAELAVDADGRLAGLPGAVAHVDPVHTRCRVVVPADKVLARELELPLAAEENLHEVLRFEMDRQTPFRATEVYFDYRILKRDSAAQKLWVYLQVARRTLVDNLIAHLGHWDLRPVHSRAPAPQEGELTLEFEPGVFRERTSGGLNLLLAALVLALAATAVLVPLQNQHQLRSELQTRLAAARLSAAQAIKIRDVLDSRIEADSILHTAKFSRTAMVDLLEELSRALPDDTYLFRLEVRDNTVSLQGSSKSASALIGILEQSPMLQNVRFASPVTREGTAGRERFHISAALLSKAIPGSPANATRNASKRT